LTVEIPERGSFHVDVRQDYYGAYYGLRSVALRNIGNGPALIENVELTVDGRDPAWSPPDCWRSPRIVPRDETVRLMARVSMDWEFLAVNPNPDTFTAAFKMQSFVITAEYTGVGGAQRQRVSVPVYLWAGAHGARELRQGDLVIRNERWSEARRRQARRVGAWLRQPLTAVARPMRRFLRARPRSRSRPHGSGVLTRHAAARAARLQLDQECQNRPMGEAPEQFDDLAQLAATAARSYAEEATARSSLDDRDWWLYLLFKRGTVQIADDRDFVVFVQGDWSDERLTFEENVEYFFKGAMSWTGALTKRGRLERRAVKSLREEWRNSGRIQLGPNLSELLASSERAAEPAP
jgi:hypothetical protein